MHQLTCVNHTEDSPQGVKDVTTIALMLITTEASYKLQLICGLHQLLIHYI